MDNDAGMLDKVSVEQSLLIWQKMHPVKCYFYLKKKKTNTKKLFELSVNYKWSGLEFSQHENNLEKLSQIYSIE